MYISSYGDDGPIAAIATPLGGALSLIRASGSTAIDLAARVFSKPAALQAAKGYQAVHGWIVDAGRPLDEVVVVVFRAPASYTGEDAVEFSCHGGPAIARAVLEALKSVGFRQALPGEFSLRAFLNGKIDLTRAEAVVDLVAAKTDQARAQAVGRLSGALERKINTIKRQLVDRLAAVELLLDYSEADGPDEAGGDGLPELDLIELARQQLVKLQSGYRVERLISQGALVVVAGLPNAGKSSLFNCLVKEERSIVSPTPGTTRDWIETWIAIGAFPIRLVDTAGLHEASDPLERIGIDRSWSLLEQADLILYLVDSQVGLQLDDRAFLERSQSAPLVRVWTKTDLGESVLPEGFLPFSTLETSGLADLIGAIKTKLEGRDGFSKDQLGIANARQKALVDRAITALDSALELDNAGLPLDLIAPELREAVNALGEITGEVGTEDILEAIFSRFCVGK